MKFDRLITQILHENANKVYKFVRIHAKGDGSTNTVDDYDIEVQIISAANFADVVRKYYGNCNEDTKSHIERLIMSLEFSSDGFIATYEQWHTELFDFIVSEDCQYFDNIHDILKEPYIKRNIYNLWGKGPQLISDLINQNTLNKQLSSGDNPIFDKDFLDEL